MVSSGRLEVRAKGHLVATVGPGQVFGEMSVLGIAVKRTATISAASPFVEVLALEGERLRQAIQEFPETREKFEKIAGDRLGQLSHDSFTKMKKFQHCSERMKYLLDLWAERRIFFPGYFYFMTTIFSNST